MGWRVSTWWLKCETGYRTSPSRPGRSRAWSPMRCSTMRTRRAWSCSALPMATSGNVTHPATLWRIARPHPLAPLPTPTATSSSSVMRPDTFSSNPCSIASTSSGSASIPSPIRYMCPHPASWISMPRSKTHRPSILPWSFRATSCSWATMACKFILAVFRARFLTYTHGT